MKSGKFINWLENSFKPKMMKIFNNPWIAGLSDGMQKMLPFIMVGSFALLYEDLVGYIPNVNWPNLWRLFTATFGLMGVYIAYNVAFQITDKLGNHKFAHTAAMTSMTIFIILAWPAAEDALASTFQSNLSASASFVSIIVAYVTAIVFNLFKKVKLMRNSGLPDFVLGWFDSLLPIAVTYIIFVAMKYWFSVDIYGVVAAIFSPVQKFAQSLPGFWLMCMLPCFFYSLGVSTWVWDGLFYPIWMAAIAENASLIASGLPASCVNTYQSIFGLSYITMGGCCATMALNVLMCFSKVKSVKSIGRVTMAPSIFNINEPIMFAAPVVFNPILMIPAYLCCTVGVVSVFFLTKIGFLPYATQFIDVTAPSFLDGILVFQTFKTIIPWIVLFVVYLLIWFPFFKVYEKGKAAEEKAEAEASNNGDEFSLDDVSL